MSTDEKDRNLRIAEAMCRDFQWQESPAELDGAELNLLPPARSSKGPS